MILLRSFGILCKVRNKMRKFFTKKRNIIAIVTVILVVICAVVAYNIYPIIYGKLYSGNHITIDLSISYEEKQLGTDDFKVECVNPEGDIETISREGYKYAVKGGEYGEYKFVVTIDAKIFDEEYIEDNIVIELKFVNANDWYISDNNCLIEIQNIDGILNCNCRIDTEYNDGTSSNYSKEKPMENGKVEFSWGI